jgi:hypothetical protein
VQWSGKGANFKNFNANNIRENQFYDAYYGMVSPYCQNNSLLQYGNYFNDLSLVGIRLINAFAYNDVAQVGGYTYVYNQWFKFKPRRSETNSGTTQVSNAPLEAELNYQADRLDVIWNQINGFSVATTPNNGNPINPYPDNGNQARIGLSTGYSYSNHKKMDKAYRIGIFADCDCDGLPNSSNVHALEISGCDFETTTDPLYSPSTQFPFLTSDELYLTVVGVLGAKVRTVGEAIAGNIPISDLSHQGQNHFTYCNKGIWINW